MVGRPKGSKNKPYGVPVPPPPAPRAHEVTIIKQPEVKVRVTYLDLVLGMTWMTRCEVESIYQIAGEVLGKTEPVSNEVRAAKLRQQLTFMQENKEHIEAQLKKLEPVEEEQI